MEHSALPDPQPPGRATSLDHLFIYKTLLYGGLRVSLIPGDSLWISCG
jgi:hypothetical protein